MSSGMLSIRKLVKLLNMKQLFFIILASHFFAVYCQPPLPSLPNFFYFVQQWPKSFCNLQINICKRTPIEEFKIHGLWLQSQSGGSTVFCPGPAFDLPGLQNLSARMEANWPDFLNATTSDGFWRKQWQKHGTCSETILHQYPYFEKALNLKDQFNLTQILRNAGIEPNGSKYNLGAIRNAIAQGTSYDPVIQCKKDIAGKYQLYQIILCLDQTGHILQNCNTYPVWPYLGCGQRLPVVFPS